MTYEIKKEKDFIEIMFEHTNGEVEPEYEKQYSLIAKDIKMDGFRPGKVPSNLIKKMIKKESIKEKVMDNFLKKEISKIKIENETFEDPEINILEEDENSFKSKVKLYLYPTIDIDKDYKNTIKNTNTETISDNFNVTQEMIEKYIEETFSSYGEEKKEINVDTLVNFFEFKKEELENENDLKEKLEEKIKNILTEEEKVKIENENYEKIIDAIIEKSEIAISDRIIQQHKQDIFENFLFQNNLDENMSIEKFCEMTGKNIETDLIEATKNKIAHYLVVTEINRQENIFKTAMDVLQNDSDKLSEETLQELFLNYQENIQEMDKNSFYITEANIEKFKKFILQKAKS